MRTSLCWTIAAAALAGCLATSEGSRESSDSGDDAVKTAFPKLKGKVTLISTPNPEGHPEFLAAIQNAEQSILLEMFHLTDQHIVDALIDAADNRHVKVSVIVDGGGLSDANTKAIFDELAEGHPNITATGSTTAFKLTHEKGMVVDGQTAFITAINLTNAYATTRDFGLIVEDPSIVREMTDVFDADVQNAANGTGTTPNLKQPNLAWSPVNSEQKLVTLIGTAKQEIMMTVENFGEPGIVQAMSDASAKGVKIRLIVPECDQNPDPLHNYPYLAKLKGVADAHVMPYPPTASTPYMHSKMILVDHKTLYVGSINFSTSSTTTARELGVIFPPSATMVDAVASTFEGDWSASIEPPAKLPTFCPKG